MQLTRLPFERLDLFIAVFACVQGVIGLIHAYKTSLAFRYSPLLIVVYCGYIACFTCIGCCVEENYTYATVDRILA